MSDPRVVVIGGGISGLAAAYLIMRSGGVDVTLLEASPRLGGKILTGELAGRTFDMGADAMLVRMGWVTALCDQLGLTDLLVSPAARRALVLARGRLRPLPLGAMLGLPTSAKDLAASRILSPLGLGRAWLGSAKPHKRLDSDREVGPTAARVFGSAYRRAIVDPLLAGIYAGDTDRMSLQSTLPQWHEALATKGHLRFTKTGGGEASPFVSFPQGLGLLVETLRDQLGPSVKTSVEALSISKGDGLEVETSIGSLQADAVVMATPAPASSFLVAGLEPDASALLGQIAYASVAVIGLHFEEALGLPDASGFLVPPADGRLMTACTFSSNKWEHLRGAGTFVRCSAGNINDSRAADMSDEELTRSMLMELHRLVGVDAAPDEVVVQRWPSSLPQYDVGHSDRTERVKTLLRPSGIFPVGAAYEGVGIAACIRQAQLAAGEVAALLSR